MEREARRLEGKVALVSGAASGIGRATALRLADEGARVFAVDLDAAGLDETRERARRAGTDLWPHRADLAQPEACREAASACVAALGGIDVLCNVAGIVFAAHFTDVTEAQWERIVAVNLGSVFFLSQAAVPALLSRQGCIVNMSSSAGLVGQAYNAPYCATKAGVVALTRSMAVEYAKRGLRVNCLCPGGVRTPLARSFAPPAGADPDLFARLLPRMRIAEPEEIAGAVAWLASAEARYVNGAVLAMDGGQTAG